MTLAKVIEELSKVDNRIDIICYPEFKQAARIGIEAVKRCQEFRKYTTPKVYMPLPGETPEN